MFGRDQKSANDEPQEGVERKKEDEDSSNGSGEGGAAKGGEDANKGDDDDDLDDDDEGAPPGVELGEMEKGEEARLDFIVQMPTKEAISKLISSSGGNAGNSVATVGRVLDIPVEVYVPETTMELMVSKLKAKGAATNVITSNRPGGSNDFPNG